jgi:hypothetical protein
MNPLLDGVELTEHPSASLRRPPSTWSLGAAFRCGLLGAGMSLLGGSIDGHLDIPEKVSRWISSMADHPVRCGMTCGLLWLALHGPRAWPSAHAEASSVPKPRKEPVQALF